MSNEQYLMHCRGHVWFVIQQRAQEIGWTLEQSRNLADHCITNPAVAERILDLLPPLKPLEDAP